MHTLHMQLCCADFHVRACSVSCTRPKDIWHSCMPPVNPQVLVGESRQMSDLQARLKDALDACAQLRKQLGMKGLGKTAGEEREEGQAAKASAQTGTGGNATAATHPEQQGNAAGSNMHALGRHSAEQPLRKMPATLQSELDLCIKISRRIQPSGSSSSNEAMRPLGRFPQVNNMPRPHWTNEHSIPEAGTEAENLGSPHSGT